MVRRVFIIHGYLSHPEEAWLPWLKVELIKRGYEVALPAMPHPDHPVIGEWVGFIATLVGPPDENTVMVGHSIGGQAVLRYLETLGSAGVGVGRTVLVAATFPTGRSAADADAEAGGNAVLTPWFASGVNAARVKAAAGRCTVILSDNDPYISVQREIAAFKAAIDPEIIIERQGAFQRG